MYSSLFIFLLIGFFYDKKLPTGDSGNYIEYAKGGFDILLNNQIDHYRFTRTFPSLLVGNIMRFFQISLTTENIKISFSLLNAFSIFIGLYYWLKIFEFFKFNLSSKIIGYIGLFINFPILKFSMFNPIITDTFAFLLGIMQLYYFFKNNKIILLFVTVIGAFTFPPLIVQGLVLYVFPFESNNNIVFKGNRINFSLIATSIYLLIVCYVFFILPGETFQKVLDKIPSGINFSLLFLSIGAICYYIYKTSSKIISYDFYKSYLIKYFSERRFWFRVIIALSVIIIVKLLTYRFASADMGESKRGFLSFVLMSPLQNPFLFLLAHILYYGPVVILIIFFWNEVAGFCNSVGLGLNLILLFCTILSFQSESRMLISLSPIILLAIINFLNTIKIKHQHLLFFILLSLVFSRFWFKIWGPGMLGPYLDFPKFPMQKYFMVQGPWMSDIMYYVQMVIVLICAIPFYLFVKKLHLTSENSYLSNKK